MQQWSVTEGFCQTDGAEHHPTYGVAVTLPDGSGWEWADVDVERAAAQTLAERLQALQPQQCHWEELVLDFIDEMAGKV